MRIGVIGLGAIGGVVAARLSQRWDWTHDRLWLAAGRRAEALRDRGLSVDGAAPLRPRVFETLPSGSYDFILLCTRTSDSESALAPALPFLAADGAVVCLQNGLPEARAVRLAGPHRVLGAVIGWSATMRAPGDYAVTGKGKFVLGGLGARRREAAQILGSVFPVRETDNLEGARFSKLAINCAMSTIGAVSGFSLGEWTALKDARNLALRIVREVVDEGTARGVRFEAVSGLRPDWLVRAPAWVADAAIELSALRRPEQRTGMIELLQSGRHAGIEDLNGLIPRPLNQRLVEMVRQIERGERRISPENLVELSAR
ncbi:MAG TPA: 2-dehydropantoate 2-reductase N-terminal domain-containing protein [Myxococcales bacterium]|jgi:2-dehydropantoate 2-reductase